MLNRRNLLKKAALLPIGAAKLPAEETVEYKHIDYLSNVDLYFRMRTEEELKDKQFGRLRGFYVANKNLFVITKHCSGAGYIFSTCFGIDEIHPAFRLFFSNRLDCYSYWRGKKLCEDSTVRLYRFLWGRIFGKWTSVQWLPNKIFEEENYYVLQMGHPASEPLFTLKISK